MRQICGFLGKVSNLTMPEKKRSVDHTTRTPCCILKMSTSITEEADCILEKSSILVKVILDMVTRRSEKCLRVSIPAIVLECRNFVNKRD
jgi:hypothetical protein